MKSANNQPLMDDSRSPAANCQQSVQPSVANGHDDGQLPIEDEVKGHEQLSFEDGVKRLEEVVRQLEQPTVSLDVALGFFGEGVALVRQCQAQLSRAEERMARLLEHPDGSLGLVESDEQ